jgi:hypothetical protein
MKNTFEFRTNFAINSEEKNRILGDMINGKGNVNDFLIKDVVIFTDTPLNGVYVPIDTQKKFFAKFNNAVVIAPKHLPDSFNDSNGVGFIRDVYFDDSINGVRCDLVINLAKLQKISSKLFLDLVNGVAINGSMAIEYNAIIGNGSHNGVKYTMQAITIEKVNNYALLEGQKGACNVKQGCGILPTTKVEKLSQNRPNTSDFNNKGGIVDTEQIEKIVETTVKAAIKEFSTLNANEHEGKPSDDNFHFTECKYKALVNKMDEVVNEVELLKAENLQLKQNLEAAENSHKELQAVVSKVKTKDFNKDNSEVKANWLGGVK